MRSTDPPLLPREWSVPLSLTLGAEADIDRAVDVYRRSNLAHWQGIWPNQAARVAQVTGRLRDPDGWFMVTDDGHRCVAMAALVPLLADDGRGPPVPDACFCSLLFVVPERWGQGIGGTLLAAVIAEAQRRGCRQLRLWTQEADNDRRAAALSPPWPFADGPHLARR